MPQYMLTKSKYIRGLQCAKALYYDVYHPQWARYDAATLSKFRMGRDFETLFKARFADGVALDQELGRQVSLYPQRTAQLLDERQEVAVFEAGFLYDQVLILADVVRRRPDGSIDVYEVKGSRRVSETFLRDMALQYYVMSHCRQVNSFSLVCRADGDGFVIDDRTADCRSQLPLVGQRIAEMKKVLCGQEPHIAPGPHCDIPYPCPYKRHCAPDDISRNAAFPLFYDNNQ